jgi:hypothetical protein
MPRSLGVLLVVGTLAAAFMAFTLLPQYDEFSTYYYFIQFGPLNTLIDYSIPNNHILFSFLFACNTKLLPWVDPIISGRIVSVLITTLLIVGSWRIFRGFSFSPSVSLIAVCSLVFSYPVLLYSGSARGYMLALVCFVWLVYLAQCLLLRGGLLGNTILDSLILAFVSVLGLWTMPSFLLVLVPVWVWLALDLWQSGRRAEFWGLLAWPILTGLGTFIVYLPPIMVSGLNKIIANEYVAPKTFSEVLLNLPNGFVKLFNYLNGAANTDWMDGGIHAVWSLSGLIFLIAIGTFASLGHFLTGFDATNSKALRLVLILLFSYPVLVLALKNPGFDRTWLHLGLCIPLLLAVALSTFSRLPYELPTWLCLLVVMGFALFGSWLVEKRQNEQYFYAHPHKLGSILVKAKSALLQADTAYFESHYHKMISTYYYFDKGIKLNSALVTFNSKSCDCLSIAKYSVLVLRTDRPRNCQPTAPYEIAYQDTAYTLWVRN